MSEFEPVPLEVLVDERLAALCDKDWERYRRLGERLLVAIDERRAFTQEDHLDWKYV